MTPPHVALNRLNHLGMLYAGAIVELANGHDKGILPMDWPGLKRTRDLFQLVLCARAELNALTALLVQKGVFTAAEYGRQIAEEADWLTKKKADQFGREDGVEYNVTDNGLSFNLGGRK